MLLYCLDKVCIMGEITQVIQRIAPTPDRVGYEKRNKDEEEWKYPVLFRDFEIALQLVAPSVNFKSQLNFKTLVQQSGDMGYSPCPTADYIEKY